MSNCSYDSYSTEYESDSYSLEDEDQRFAEEDEEETEYEDEEEYEEQSQSHNPYEKVPEYQEPVLAEVGTWVEEARKDQRKVADEIKVKKELWILAVICALIICAGTIVVIIMSAKEKSRTLGMVFEARSYHLPSELRLPEGQLQLRTFMLPLPTPKGDFTPFIASTQQPGRINIVTNATHPDYNSYYVEHPWIMNAVMITDAFFCSAKTCFFLTDANNDTFFNDPIAYRNLTKQLVEVPLPVGFSFVKTEFCAFLHNPNCTILLEDSNGNQRFGTIRKKGFLPTVDVNVESFEVTGGVKAFCNSVKFFRIISWNDNKLAVFTADHPNDVTYIKNVEEEEIVEVLALSDAIQIVLVMKEMEGRTRVQIFALSSNNEVVRRDEMIILNNIFSITPVIRENSFELCHLSRSHIYCYANVVQ